jgi:pimeloyl-ACP methyl ester carboxylesterase
MQKYSRIFDNDKASPIYFIVPGFLGNYSEDFIGRLYVFLIENNFNVRGVTFRGHENNETELASLFEMVANVESEYVLLRKDYPERRIIILAHSQGCAVALKAANCFDEKTSFILFSPVVYIDRVILPRIKEDDLRLIESGAAVVCKISRYKSRIINLDWILSYRNFLLEESLPRVKQECLIVRPREDWIEKENIDILCQKLAHQTYLEVSGDHIFAVPEAAFENLVKKIFL